MVWKDILTHNHTIHMPTCFRSFSFWCVCMCVCECACARWIRTGWMNDESREHGRLVWRIYVHTFLSAEFSLITLPPITTTRIRPIPTSTSTSTNPIHRLPFSASSSPSPPPPPLSLSFRRYFFFCLFVCLANRKERVNKLIHMSSNISFSLSCPSLFVWFSLVQASISFFFLPVPLSVRVYIFTYIYKLKNRSLKIIHHDLFNPKSIFYRWFESIKIYRTRLIEHSTFKILNVNVHPDH